MFECQNIYVYTNMRCRNEKKKIRKKRKSRVGTHIQSTRYDENGVD